MSETSGRLGRPEPQARAIETAVADSHRVRWIMLSVLGLLALAPGTLRAQSFRGLGDLPGGGAPRSFGQGVSADGLVVVGFGFTDAGYEAFRWTEASGMQGLGLLPGATFTQAYDCSDDGSLVVGYGGTTAWSEAFRWTAEGGMEGLGHLEGGGAASVALGVSGDGAVAVGWADPPQQWTQEAFRWTANGGMQGLGDIPGGNLESQARDVSASGEVIVGWGTGGSGVVEAWRWTEASGLQGLGAPWSQAFGVSADGGFVVGGALNLQGDFEAFRWTEAGGVQGLGDLPGGGFTSQALGVSTDGSVVVGFGTGAGGQEAFVWTAADGMRSVKALLQSTYGLDLTGWTLTEATDVSADGTVLVGNGWNPQGSREAWRAHLSSPLTVLAPAEGDLLVAGQKRVLRWRRPDWVESVNVFFLPDSLGTPFETLILDFDNDSLLWTPADSLFSRSARIAVKDAADPTTADTTGFFRIKPYHLTRVSADSSLYVPYDVRLHGWSFGNREAELFPQSWWGQDQFNYFGGRDPLSLLPYDPSFPLAPTNAFPHVFADWPAYARAFGIDDAYWIVVPGVTAPYRESFVARWAGYHGGTGWGGACSGMAVASLLAFGHRTEFGEAHPSIGPVERIHDVGMSDDVREMINTYYCYWAGLQQQQHVVGASRDPRTVLEDLKAKTLSEDRSGDAYLYISDAVGAHAVAPYRLEPDPGSPGLWFVFVYDPNLPDDDTAIVVIDSTSNSWSYAGFTPAWGGADGMFIMDPAVGYLQEAQSAPGVVPLHEFPNPSEERSGGSEIYVSATPGAEVRLTGAEEGEVGYGSGAAFNTLEGARLDVPPVGGPAAPVGYFLPSGAYTLELGSFPGPSASAAFFDGEIIYAYGRQNLEALEADRLAYDPAGGLLACSEDPTDKLMTLRGIVTSPSWERVLEARDLGLAGADSVRFTVESDSGEHRLRLENGGGGKSYTLRLRRSDEEGRAEFLHHAVPLDSGATHVARPDWTTLGEGTVEVDVDLDGDGVFDETIVLENEAASVDPWGTGGTDRLVLHGAFPNPFAVQTVLRYDLPRGAWVRVAVFDALGREVARPADGWRDAGRHEERLNGEHLPSGVYFVRLVTDGGLILAQRVTAVR